MPATEPLCHLMGINFSKLSKEERLLLEAEIFIKICNKLKNFFREQHKNYFRLMKFTNEMESSMLDKNFVCLVIKDILSTGEYTLEGIATYADSHEDIVVEVVSGCNTNPSAIFQRKIIELHRSVRQELYRAIIKKIISEYLAENTRLIFVSK